MVLQHGMAADYKATKPELLDLYAYIRSFDDGSTLR